MQSVSIQVVCSIDFDIEPKEISDLELENQDSLLENRTFRLQRAAKIKPIPVNHLIFSPAAVRDKLEFRDHLQVCH